MYAASALSRGGGTAVGHAAPSPRAFGRRVASSVPSVSSVSSVPITAGGSARLRSLCARPSSSAASFGSRSRPGDALLPATAAGRLGLRPYRGRTFNPTLTRAASAAASPDFGGAESTSSSPSSSGEADGDRVSITAVIRAMCFYLVTFTLAIPLFVAMLAMFPFTYLADKHRRYALSFINDVWACVSTWLFFPVKVIGRENLPAVETPAVYVANHASYLDIYSLFHLRRPFKFISKVSNFIIPIIGWSMYLTGHIALKRTDRKSQMKTLKECRELLRKDCSVLFFPEGTRSADGKMAEFKKGAFSIAAKEKALVVPITLVGTAARMKNGKVPNPPT